MKKLFKKETLKRDINLLFIIVAFIIVILFLHKPWYILFSIYFIYFIINYILFLGTSLGNTGYLIESTLHNKNLAHKFYKLAIRFNTKSSYALTSYGLHLLREGNTKEALILFKKILKIKNAKPLIVKYTYSNLAICHWKLNNVDKAIKILEKMLDDYEYFNADFYTTLGFMYVLKGDYENALKYTKKALEENEGHGPAYDNLGQIYYRQNDLEKAEENFIKALELKNTMADSNYYLGLIYEQQSKEDLAKKYFAKAHTSNINALNTVTREQVAKKYNQYFK